MKDLKKLLIDNNIKYIISDYCGFESIVIINNKYKLEIFEDEIGLVSDLQKVPYTWGIMGSTSLEEIINDLNKYLNINILFSQLSLF